MVALWHKAWNLASLVAGLVSVALLSLMSVMVWVAAIAVAR